MLIFPSIDTSTGLHSMDLTRVLVLSEITSIFCKLLGKNIDFIGKEKRRAAKRKNHFRRL